MVGSIKLPPTVTGSSATADIRDGYVNSMRRLSGSVYARVTGVNWYTHTITCVGMYNQHGAGPWYDVPVISSTLTQSEGVRWMPSIEPPKGDTISEQATIDGESDAIAVLDFIGGDIMRPVCLGFVHGSSHEFSFGEEGTKLERHNSGIYTRTTKTGTFEFSFPCGSFVKVAPVEEGTDLTDLSGKNIRDAKTRPWSIPQDNPRTMTVSHSTGSSFSINETGEISITGVTGSTATLSIDGTISLSSPSGALILIGGDGSITINSSSSVSLSAPSGSISVSGISLTSHTHQYSNQDGTQTTTGPQ